MNPGNNGGVEQVALTATQIPAHSHDINAVTTAGTKRVPTGNAYAAAPSGTNLFGLITSPPTPAPPLVTLSPKMLSSTGGGASHPNLQPYLVLNYCIAIVGLFPPRN